MAGPWAFVLNISSNSSTFKSYKGKKMIYPSRSKHPNPCCLTLCQNCSPTPATLRPQQSASPWGCGTQRAELGSAKSGLHPQQPPRRSTVQENIHVSTQALSSRVPLRGAGRTWDLRTRLRAAPLEASFPGTQPPTQAELLQTPPAILGWEK